MTRVKAPMLAPVQAMMDGPPPAPAMCRDSAQQEGPSGDAHLNDTNREASSYQRAVEGVGHLQKALRHLEGGLGMDQRDPSAERFDPFSRVSRPCVDLGEPDAEALAMPERTVRLEREVAELREDVRRIESTVSSLQAEPEQEDKIQNEDLPSDIARVSPDYGDVCPSKPVQEIDIENVSGSIPSIAALKAEKDARESESLGLEAAATEPAGGNTFPSKPMKEPESESECSPGTASPECAESRSLVEGSPLEKGAEPAAADAAESSEPRPAPKKGGPPPPKGKGKGKAGKGPPPPPPSGPKAKADAASPQPPLPGKSAGKGKGKGPKGGKGGPGVPPKGPPPPRSVPKAGQMPGGMPKAESKAPFLKKLYWKQVDLQDAEGTIFSEESRARSNTCSAAIDFTALTRMLEAEQAKGSQLQRRSSGVLSKAQQRNIGTKVLSDHRARNIAIVLKRLPLSTKELAAVLKKLEWENGRIGTDDLEQILEAIPTHEEAKHLREHASEEACQKLRDVEQMVMPLALLSRASARVRVLCVARNARLQFKSTARTLAKIRSACFAIQKSGMLRSVMLLALQLGNYINHGDSKKGAKAIAISSLMALRDFKAGDISSLHFLCASLLRSNPKLDAAQSLLKERKP